MRPATFDGQLQQTGMCRRCLRRQQGRLVEPVGRLQVPLGDGNLTLRRVELRDEGGAHRATLFFCPARREAAAGARLNSSLNGGREVNQFPQRRARAPLACLRAKGARRSRAVRSAPQPGTLYGGLLVGCRGAKLIISLKRRAVKLMISLNGGRSLRSLAYAPFGAARGRALRTAVRPSPWPTPCRLPGV